MTLGGRLALVFAGLVALTALLIGGTLAVTTGTQVSDEIDSFLLQRAEEYTNGQRRQPNRPGRVAPATQPEAARPLESDAEVQLLSQDGEVESTSGPALPVSAADIALAERRGSPVLATVTVDGTEYRMATRHLEGGGAVQVARSLDESNSLLSVLRSKFLGIALGMAAVAGGIGWMIAQRTTRPLRSLARAVDSVAETGDFTVSVPATGQDEVGRLTRGFDRMLGALETSREQQRRLVQDAAHELRTPLTSIKANVDWLRRAEDLDAEARSATLAGVQRELDELNSVVSEIVELAVDGSDQPNFGPVDLAEVADDAVTQFRARWDRPVTLRAEPSPVTGDAGALQRAITNLLANAHKYSPAGAPIEVDVGPDGLWVSDHGDGIPEADRGRVVDRFFRREEHRGQPGSGLGLSIVTSIVNNHGGAVLVGEADGGGARVGFRLGQGSGLGRPVATATS